MNRYFCGVVLALALAAPVRAEESLESLKKQLEQMQQQMLQMEEKIKELEKKEAVAVAPEAKKEEAAETAAATPATKWSPEQPLTLAKAGNAYLNLSMVVQVDIGTSTEPEVRNLQLGGHDPNQRGFSLPTAEIALDGAVDPYFKGFANINFQIDDEAETLVELEEAYLLTSSLPWNLQAKGGQFLTAFGRQNQQHPHAWAFVDVPVVLARLLGPDGLRSLGGQMSWLAPTPFFTEVMMGVFNGQGETAFSFRDPENTYGRAPVDRGISSMADLLYVPRLSSAFDLNDTQTLVLGLSGAFGPNNSGASTSTAIYGADVYWKWRPTNASQGFPFVSWQTEWLWRNYQAGADGILAAADYKDWGIYSQVLWGFRRGWVAGLRGEYATGNAGVEEPANLTTFGDRFRLSPAITWFPSEFSKVRLQYNYDHGDEIGNQSSVWMQFEFLLGAHGAHKF